MLSVYISFLIVTIGGDLLYPCTTAMHVIVIFHDFIFLPLYLLFGSFLRFVRISASGGVVGWRFGTTKTCWKPLSGPKSGCYSVAGSELPFIVHSLFLSCCFTLLYSFASFFHVKGTLLAFIDILLSFIWLVYCRCIWCASSHLPILFSSLLCFYFI